MPPLNVDMEPGPRRKQFNYLVRSSVLPLFLFTVGFLPRILALDAFFTPDAVAWMERSTYFLEGLLTRNWMATLRTGHPGVTTMWTGSIGILYCYWTRPPSAPNDLLAFVQQIPLDPPEASYIAPMYFPTALLASLFVVAFYALISRLFHDRRVGAVAALLLSLSPFHIGLSRVLHNDALAAIFMTLSLLPLLGYWLQGWSRRWLLVSGIAAGLSFLSKSPAMFLMPFCALLGLLWAARRWRRREWRGWHDFKWMVADGILWGGVSWLTVWLLWPAMWVSPLQVLDTVFSTGSTYMVEGHGHGAFFLGQISADPGPLFYPVTWLLRTTPLVLLGFAVWAAFYVRGVSKVRAETNSLARTLSGMLFLYAILFTAFITLGDKKQDRYLLPIYPAVETLAALGLIQISSLCFGRFANVRLSKSARQRAGSVQCVVCNPQFLVSLVILLFHGALVVANYPYYFTYYNPLLGGAPMAARLMTVGWGEGLDKAAAYLNDLPGADRLHVTAWYHYSFATFFRGQATGYSSQPGNTLSSDYAVVYRNQIQRELPTPELMRYLLRHHTPVFTVTLQGLDHVYVYRLSLARRSDWQASRLPSRATFFGVGETDRLASQWELSSETETDADDSSLSLRLYWQNEGLAASDRWWVALQPVAGPIQLWQECPLVSGFTDERLMVNALLENECQLVGERFAPDVYHLRVGVGPDPDQITIIPFPEGEFAVAVQDDGMLHLVSRPTALGVLSPHLLPPGAHPADLVYHGTVRLIGYATEDISTSQGRDLQMQMYWLALQAVPLAELAQSLKMEVTLLSLQGAALARVESSFSDPETWPATWPVGQVLTRTLSLKLPGSVPPQAQLRLEVWLNGQQLNPLDSSGEMVEPNLPAFMVQ